MARLHGLTVTKLLDPKSCAATANATSAWVDITQAEGDILIQVSTGVISAGGIVWSLHHATASDGTGDAAITPEDGAFAAVTANTTQTRVINANQLGPYLQLVGTITTGPVFTEAVLIYQKDTPTT